MALDLGPRATHIVTNQPPPLVDYNVFDVDQALKAAVGESQTLTELGEFAGSVRAAELATQANTNTPVLKTHDRYGNRIDQVDYHPAYHELMGKSVAHGIQHKGGSHLERAAKLYVMSQAEGGHICPISMTYSAVPALQAAPELLKQWLLGLTSVSYDPRPLPALQKSGLLCGMAMTEKQGGSDVRANQTTAMRISEGLYSITGHKWFCSAPMCDAFLILSQTSNGLTCFLMPRWMDDGPNAIRIHRLKDKLGNRSNASSEIELDGALAHIVGDEGRGVQTIIEMVTHTRLDCVLGSAATMRQGTVQAIHHCRHRSAFGKHLIEAPLMQNVLSDLAVESEAATVSAMRLARAYDNPDEMDFRRLATAVMKYWICKRASVHALEASECLGGNGYVEESGMPRLVRDSPLNSIWEGSGNVICLDVLRAMSRNPQSGDAFWAEVDLATKLDSRLESFVRQTKKIDQNESNARRLVEAMALCLQGSILMRTGHPAVTEVFCRTRLSGDWGRAFGTIPDTPHAQDILDRAWAN